MLPRRHWADDSPKASPDAVRRSLTFYLDVTSPCLHAGIAKRLFLSACESKMELIDLAPSAYGAGTQSWGCEETRPCPLTSIPITNGWDSTSS